MGYKIAEQLAPLAQYGVRLFRDESSNPKWDAQRNLQGRTHYVDDDTLRFHKSRILSARLLHGGAFYYVRESSAGDIDNTWRAHRVVLFDVFGNVVGERPSLDDSARTGEAAEREFWAWFETFDEAAYYAGVLAEMAQRMRKEANGFDSVMDSLIAGEVAA